MAPKNPNQLSSLVIDDLSHQMTIPIADPSLGVSTIEHYILLQGVVSNLIQASKHGGHVRSDDYRIQTDQEHKPEPYRRNIENSYARSIDEAKRLFLQASGNLALVATNQMTEDEMENATRGMFNEFYAKYYGRVNHKAASDYLGELADNVRVLQWEQEPSKKKRGIRKQTPFVKVEVPTEPADRKLDTRDKLRAIVEEPRLGYIPTSHREKTTILNLTDYLVNPDFPYRVNNQFLEDFTHTQKVRKQQAKKNKDGVATAISERAALSVTYEIGDYLIDATAHRLALIKLNEHLRQLPNLRVTLGEEKETLGELDLDDPAFIALIRYRDLRDYVATGESVVLGDPLITRTERWLDSKHKAQIKHKAVFDSYNDVNMKDATKAKIKQAIADMTVGEARSLIEPAIIDQTRREAVMVKLLGIVSDHSIIDWRSARKVLTLPKRVAEDILKEHETWLLEAA
jgi:hypothetical protein